MNAIRNALKMVSLAALAAAALVAAVGAAPDTKPPRIVSALMQDRDGDFRADTVRLTYSEPVRHALDRDGKYPFRVAGYRIRSVSKASGKTVLIAIVQSTLADAAARPAITYKRTNAGAVRDRARNQAQAQVYRATKAHGRTPADPNPDPGPPPPPRPGDRDGDGTPDERDCAPDDHRIHPGAADLPDLAFVDSNCDGIDGDEAKAIFVSPEGKQGNLGTKAQPIREIHSAAVAAALLGRDIYAAGGTYGRVELTADTRIYGGYDPKSWQRRANVQTIVSGAPEGILVRGGAGVLFQHLTVNGAPAQVPSQRGQGATAYGIRATGSSVTLEGVVVRALDGSEGPSGARGRDGVKGEDGGHGSRGLCDEVRFVGGGRGGSSPAGSLFAGGNGGQGGARSHIFAGDPSPAGVPGGAGGASGNPGKPGLTGSRGTDGDAGLKGEGGPTVVVGTELWSAAPGGRGVSGGHGTGGGGGGGGGGQIGLFVHEGNGSGGGGGGGGGEAGQPGDGGGSGGSSIGIYLHASTLTASQSSIIAGNGGRGGNGGDGGLGGPGGARGGAWAFCTSEIGAGGLGGAGGSGGRGGGGGGGAGGSSIGVASMGRSDATLTGTTIRVGAPGGPGAAGAGGGGGTAAHPGFARPIHAP